MESETKQTSQPEQSFDVYKCMAWLHANRKAVIAGAVLAAIIGSAIGIYSWKKSQDELEANAKFFALPPVFGSSEKAVHPTAAQLFSVAKEYPNTSIGEQADLLAAGTLFTEAKSKEDFEKAKAAFSKFLTDHPDSQLGAQASIGVAASAEAAGDSDAIQLYQQAITRYPGAGTADPAKLTVARLYEEQGKPEEALRYYDELTRGAAYGNPWASEAQERKAALLAKNPKLAKAAPALSPLLAPAAAPVAKPQPAPATPAPKKSK